MSNSNFSPQWSTDNIWNGVFMEECLTDELEAMKADIDSKADDVHEHSEYASASNMTQLQNLIGNTSVASQISSAVSKKADTNHTHDGYIAANTPLDNVVVSMSIGKDASGVELLNNFGKTCRYYPSLGIVFLRMYGVTTQSMTAGEAYTLASVNSNAPTSNHALAIKCSSKSFSALISSAGNVNVTPLESVSAGQSAYISGFWFV